jgi:hypothetical protein
MIGTFKFQEPPPLSPLCASQSQAKYLCLLELVGIFHVKLISKHHELVSVFFLSLFKSFLLEQKNQRLFRAFFQMPSIKANCG